MQDQITQLAARQAKDTAELKALAQDESWEMRARAIEACGYEGIAFREDYQKLMHRLRGTINT